MLKSTNIGLCHKVFELQSFEPRSPCNRSGCGQSQNLDPNCSRLSKCLGHGYHHPHVATTISDKQNFLHARSFAWESSIALEEINVPPKLSRRNMKQQFVTLDTLYLYEFLDKSLTKAGTQRVIRPQCLECVGQ